MLDLQRGIAEQMHGGKNLFEVPQGMHTGQPRLGHSDLAASCDVEHPKRNLEEPTDLDVF